MKMTRFEKRLVNRKTKGQRNIKKVRERLSELDVATIEDVLELGCGAGTWSVSLRDVRHERHGDRF